MSIEDMLSFPNSNPYLQPKIKEAREMFRYAAIFFLIAALVTGLWGLVDILSGLIFLSGFSILSGIVKIVLAVLAILIKDKFVDNVITPIDQGMYRISQEDIILYMILGFIFGLLISGILILLGYIKFNEIDTQAKNCPDCRSTLRYVQQYDNWYCDNCGDYKVPVHAAQPSTTPPPGQQQQPQQQSPPKQQQSSPAQQQQSQQPPPQQPQQQQPRQQQQQPSPPPQQQKQENQCPDCSEQMRHIDEYDRWYCDNCQEYK